MQPADQVFNVRLSSPDVQLLKLASPELEKLVLQQYDYYQQLQSKDTSKLGLDAAAGDDYTRSFVDAFIELRAYQPTDCEEAVGHRTSAAASTFQTDAVRASVCSTQTHTGYCQTVAAGPRTSASDHVTFSDTPPTSPMNLADDERIRQERKRARNRVAAMRCRNRKLERIKQLQSQADRLRAANLKLANDVIQLRETVSKLREDVLLHADCQLTMPPLTLISDT